MTIFGKILIYPEKTSIPFSFISLFLLFLWIYYKIILKIKKYTKSILKEDKVSGNSVNCFTNCFIPIILIYFFLEIKIIKIKVFFLFIWFFKNY